MKRVTMVLSTTREDKRVSRAWLEYTKGVKAPKKIP
jgi:hypothetical protein